MKILQINQCHYRRGGADIVYLDSIDLLRSKGHEVASFSTLNSLNEDSNYKDYFIKSVDLRNSSILNKIINVKPYLYNSSAYDNLKKLIYDFKPDIAHVHLFYNSLSVSVLEVLHDFNIPIVHTVHDFKLLCPVNSFMRPTKNVCESCAKGSSFNCIINKCSDGKLLQSSMLSLESNYWRYFKNPISYIDSFHFVSNFFKEKHIGYLPEIKDKSFMFYNFSSLLPRFKDNSEKYFLYFGRLSNEKGIQTLIDSWKELPEDMKLKIVGEGPLFKKLSKEVFDLELMNVEFLGYKKGNELNQLIENAYFIVVTSECYENNPMTIIESYSLGIPVIGSNFGGIPEIITENETGFMFNPKNKNHLKEKVIKADNLSLKEYLQFSKNALNFANKNFSENNYYQKLINLYNNTIEKCNN